MSLKNKIHQAAEVSHSCKVHIPSQIQIANPVRQLYNWRSHGSLQRLNFLRN
jgi:hypothetical protein